MLLIPSRKIYTGLAVESYTTKTASRYEFHKKFVDIQYILSGEEYIYVASMQELFPQAGQGTSANALELDSEFNDAKDIGFLKNAPQHATRVHLVPNMHCVIFPWEAHMPCMAVGEPVTVQKSVVKVPLNDFLRNFSADMIQPYADII